MGKGGHRGGGSRGGGGGSGGYHGSSYSSYSSRSYGSSGGGSDCDAGACMGVMGVISFIGLMITIIIMTTADDITMDIGETRAWSMSAAPYFVKEYNIKDYSDRIDVYYVESPTLTKPGDEKPIKIDESQSIGANEYRDFIYYLNGGSILDVKFQAANDGSAIDAYIFNSKSQFSSWSSSWRKGHNVLGGYTLYRHSSAGAGINMHLRVPRDGGNVFYVVFVNEYHRSARVNFNIQLQRTHYILDNVSPVCGPNAKEQSESSISSNGGPSKDNEWCNLPITIFDKRKVIMKSPPIDLPIGSMDSEGIVKGNGSGSGSGNDGDASPAKPKPEEGAGGSTDESAHSASKLDDVEVTYEVEAYGAVRWLGYLSLPLAPVFLVLLIANLWECYQAKSYMKWFSSTSGYTSIDNDNATSSTNEGTGAGLMLTATTAVDTSVANPIQIATVINEEDEGTETDSTKLSLKQPSAPHIDI
jgi:hypothetical protein